MGESMNEGVQSFEFQVNRPLCGAQGWLCTIHDVSRLLAWEGYSGGVSTALSPDPDPC